MDLSAGVEQLRGAVIDGRTDNVRYRQNELQSLHASLRNNVDRILSAMSEDACGSSAAEISHEAQSEYFLAMKAVKHLYLSLDFEKSLKNEYLIANGADNPSRRVGKGFVIIRPTVHTRFYSVIYTLATAITAGNCTCLELEDTTSNIDRVLKDLLPQALDNDTFCISNKGLQGSTILESAFLVDQINTSSNSTSNQLVSDASVRTIAVVDRGADIELAAKTLVTARFSFQGTSPYSPDLVIVNDFVKNDLMEACTRYASKFFSLNSKAKRPQNNNDIATKIALKEAEKTGQVSIFGSNNFGIVDVHERNASIVKMKISSCQLLMMECTSLVDAIMSQKSESPLLAAYLFADPPTAKFLAQHLNSRVIYVNQIPLHLLIGPAAPSTPISIPAYHKYSVEMFSSERPQYITPPPRELGIINELLAGSQRSVTTVELLAKMQSSAVEPLPKTGQPLGHAIGFFEQGIMLGGGLFLTVLLPTLGYGSWLLGKTAWGLLLRTRTL